MSPQEFYPWSSFNHCFPCRLVVAVRPIKKGDLWDIVKLLHQPILCCTIQHSFQYLDLGWYLPWHIPDLHVIMEWTIQYLTGFGSAQHLLCWCTSYMKCVSFDIQPFHTSKWLADSKCWLSTWDFICGFWWRPLNLWHFRVPSFPMPFLLPRPLLPPHAPWPTQGRILGEVLLWGGGQLGISQQNLVEGFHSDRYFTIFFGTLSFFLSGIKENEIQTWSIKHVFSTC